MDSARLSVDNGARVAHRVVAVIGDDARLAPTPAAVVAASEHQVDVARVGATVLAGLAERQQRALRGDQQGGDAVAGVAALSAYVEVVLLGWEGG